MTTIRRMLQIALQLAFLSLLLIQAISQLFQDKSIYGKFEQAVIPIDAKERAQVPAKCFRGNRLHDLRGGLSR